MTADTAATIDPKRVERFAKCFDATGRFQRWPAKRSEKDLVLWVLWALIPAATRYDEAEINAMLRDWHDAGDFATLRRELCDLGLLRRTPDGRIYMRVPGESPPEAKLVAQRFAMPSR